MMRSLRVHETFILNVEIAAAIKYRLMQATVRWMGLFLPALAS
jgi:hypothetical protein